MTLHCNRNASVFEAVLDFTQHGHLHAPLNLCPNVFVRDLGFWGLCLGDLGPCCYTKIADFLGEQAMVNEILRDTQAKAGPGSALPAAAAAAAGGGAVAASAAAPVAVAVGGEL